MFGFPMRIVLNGKTVILRPPKKAERAELDDSIERARKALELAQEVVKFM